MSDIVVAASLGVIITTLTTWIIYTCYRAGEMSDIVVAASLGVIITTLTICIIYALFYLV
jgi:hypothetical protein